MQKHYLWAAAGFVVAVLLVRQTSILDKIVNVTP